ncbi:MAG: protein-L-isoaspartate O-methyltransferase family protein [Devosia sp.]
MADFATARRRMVDNQLRTSNVTDRRILSAMDEVPRERFIPGAREGLVYGDTVHDLGHGRSLAPPAPFARLIQLAEIKSTDAVLDIGTGTGYSTAVLARLAAEVTGLESSPELAAKARELLGELGVGNAGIVEGSLDGAGQRPGSYDVIVLEGAVAEEPTGLFPLLKDGGRLVGLLQGEGPGVAHLYVRSGRDVASRGEFNAALPLLNPAPRTESFVF